MYYIEQDNKIIMVDDNYDRLKRTLERTLEVQPQFADLEIKEVQEGYVIYDFELMTVEEKEEKVAKKEHARINELFMTRSDFFDGTIQAWGIGQDELLVLIQALLATLPIEDVKKLMAINNFRNALNFYRKHDLLKMLVGYPIPLNETLQITITDEQLDRFFDEVNKGNKDTAWQELPQPELIIKGETDESTNN